METKNFVDYYKILEIGYLASSSAITRKFHHLARVYHPDNHSTGDRAKFDLVLLAHSTLKDPIKRKKYHDENHERLPALQKYFAEWENFQPDEIQIGDMPPDDDYSSEYMSIERDSSIQNSLLTMLYFKRRKNIREPGMGDAELERLSSCPQEHLEFHLWYLKSKGWIATGEDGLMSITAAGVDRAAFICQGENAQRLITDQS